MYLKTNGPIHIMGGGNERPGCWFDFSMGDIDFIMLDCRYYRENPKEVDNPSMLGEYQKKWAKGKTKSIHCYFQGYFILCALGQRTPSRVVMILGMVSQKSGKRYFLLLKKTKLGACCFSRLIGIDRMLGR